MYNLLLLKTKYKKYCATIEFNTYYSHTNLNIDKDGIKIIKNFMLIKNILTFISF